MGWTEIWSASWTILVARPDHAQTLQKIVEIPYSTKVLNKVSLISLTRVYANKTFLALGMPRPKMNGLGPTKAHKGPQKFGPTHPYLFI